MRRRIVKTAERIIVLSFIKLHWTVSASHLSRSCMESLSLALSVREEIFNTQGSNANAISFFIFSPKLLIECIAWPLRNASSLDYEQFASGCCGATFVSSYIIYDSVKVNYDKCEFSCWNKQHTVTHSKITISNIFENNLTSRESTGSSIVMNLVSSNSIIRNYKHLENVMVPVALNRTLCTLQICHLCCNDCGRLWRLCQRSNAMAIYQSIPAEHSRAYFVAFFSSNLN